MVRLRQAIRACREARSGVRVTWFHQKANVIRRQIVWRTPSAKVRLKICDASATLNWWMKQDSARYHLEWNRCLLKGNVRKRKIAWKTQLAKDLLKICAVNVMMDS
ncbi:unnamed protein product [Darwinula stevensoni]|uniref:Uncharacterized protein n=1 Tax=Darwinula stevensoni TaxID=69355 RepID=A0A7R9AF41_9CRUS|nr:unnamed protein product [Darwinula stevensoni]CAG0902931.1 unnamed protein product [Darwinula stevensoni]